MGKTSWQIKDVLLRDRYSFLVQMEGSDTDPGGGGVGGGTRSARVVKATNPLPRAAGEAIGFAPEMRVSFTHHSRAFISGAFSFCSHHLR